MATLQSEVEKAFYLYDSGQSLELYRDVDGNVQVGIQGAIEEFAQPRTRSEMAQSPEVMAIDPMMGASGRPDPAYLEARASLPMEKQKEMFEREAFQAIGAPLGLSIATLMTLPDLISLPPLIAAGMITAEEGKKFENVLNMLKYVPSAQVGEFLKEQGKNLGFSDAQVEAFGEGYLGGELSSIVVNAVPGAKQLVKGAKWLKDSAVDYAAGAPARVAERGRFGRFTSGMDLQGALDEMIVAGKKSDGEVDTSYRMAHQPRGPDDEDPIRLDNLTQATTGESAGYPDDFYTPQGQRIYAQGPSFEGDEYGIANLESYKAISRLRGKPNSTVTIYRGVPNDPNITTINKGDFVTLSKKYAEIHAASGYGRNGDEAGKVISQKVKVKDVYWDGNDVNEFGYFPTKGKAQ